jgi:hypothetical protein
VNAVEKQILWPPTKRLMAATMAILVMHCAIVSGLCLVLAWDVSVSSAIVLPLTIYVLWQANKSFSREVDRRFEAWRRSELEHSEQ